MVRSLSRSSNQEHGVSLSADILRLGTDSRMELPDNFAGRLPGKPGSPERIACLAGRARMGAGVFGEPTPQEAEELRRTIRINEENAKFGRIAPDSDDSDD